MKKVIHFTKDKLNQLPTPQKRTEYYDDIEDKLCLQITPNGCKTFYLIKKIDGKVYRIKIGRFPDMAIENARSRSRELKAQIEQGINPADKKRELKKEITFYKMYEKFREDSKMYKKASSIRNDEYNIKYCEPLYNMKLSKISSEDIYSLFKDITNKNGKSQASHVLEFIRAMFNRMIKVYHWNYMNPTQGIEKHPKVKRKRFIKPEEFPIFVQQLKTMPQYFQDAVLLSIYLGGRKSNILGMSWKNISFKTKKWFIPETEAKNNDSDFISINKEALKILKRRYDTRESNEWVFPSKLSKTEHIMDIKRQWKQLMKKINDAIIYEGDKITDLRFHDLRRTFGSYQAMNGESLIVIAKNLTHKSTQSTEVYARLNDKTVIAASQRAAESINSAIEGKYGEDIDDEK